MDVQVEIIMDSYVASQGHTCTTSGNLSLYSQGDFSVECEQGLSGQRDIMYRHNVCEEFVENSTDSTKSAEIPLVPDLSKFRCNIVDPNNNTDHLHSKLSDTTAMAQCSYSFLRDIGSGLMVDFMDDYYVQQEMIMLILQFSQGHKSSILIIVNPDSDYMVKFD